MEGGGAEEKLEKARSVKLLAYQVVANVEELQKNSLHIQCGGSLVDQRCSVIGDDSTTNSVGGGAETGKNAQGFGEWIHNECHFRHGFG